VHEASQPSASARCTQAAANRHVSFCDGLACLDQFRPWVHFGNPLSTSTIRTRVPIAFGKHALSVFFCTRLKLFRMRPPTLWRLRRITLWVIFDLGLACGLLAIAAWADTSAKLHQPASVGCYCGCGMSKSSVGCAKMCDLPKYATRRWAVTCVKPHASTPEETHDAQPHLPHPPHAERASN
jgi:hypothetical protein